MKWNDFKKKKPKDGQTILFEYNRGHLMTGEIEVWDSGLSIWIGDSVCNIPKKGKWIDLDLVKSFIKNK